MVSFRESVTLVEEAWPPGMAVGLGCDFGLWVSSDSVSAHGLPPGMWPGISGDLEICTDHAAHCRAHQQPLSPGFPCLI